jgi:hypothetical protein
MADKIINELLMLPNAGMNCANCRRNFLSLSDIWETNTLMYFFKLLLCTKSEVNTEMMYNQYSFEKW